MKIVLTKEDIENLSNSVPNEVEKLLYLIRRNIMEESNQTPTVTSKVTKVSRMTMGIGEKKK